MNNYKGLNEKAKVKLPQQQPNNSQFILKSLRTINKQDTFPCFSCFDQYEARINCTTCDKLGFVRGDHPMVLFVDDFLVKNLPEQLKNNLQVNQNDYKKSQGNSQCSDDQTNYLVGSQMLSNRKQCRSALESYQNSKPQKMQQIPHKLMKSSNPHSFKQKQQVHQGFGCNECSAYPIRGKRIHCLQCEDYDICESCHKKGGYTQGHRASHRIQIVTLNKTQDFIMQFTKSSIIKGKR